jgi:hypothetical protein
LFYLLPVLLVLVPELALDFLRSLMNSYLD